MRLKDFISNALVDICSGISEAKKMISNGAVAPTYKINADGTKENTGDMEYIDFEVCVTVDNTSSNNNKSSKSVGFLKVISANIGKYQLIKSRSSSSNINKISFRVPFLPQAVMPAEKINND